MTSLDISDNAIGRMGTQLLAEALKGNQILTELNLSSNYMTLGGLSGVVALADAIPDMGALTSLNISDNDLADRGRNMSGKPRERMCLDSSFVYHFCVSFPFLQVLPLSLMPSAAIGQYPL
jgi:hypothetical protein